MDSTPDTSNPADVPPTHTPTIAAAILIVAAFLPAVIHWYQRVPVPTPALTAKNARTLATRINPNLATVGELMTLRGIGPALANRIVEFRTQARDAYPARPPFRRLEDLDDVRGIGPKTLEKLRPYLTFPASQQ